MKNWGQCFAGFRGWKIYQFLIKQTISRKEKRVVSHKNYEIIILPSLAANVKFLLFIEFQSFLSLNIEWIFSFSISHSPFSFDCHILKQQKLNFWIAEVIRCYQICSLFLLLGGKRSKVTFFKRLKRIWRESKENKFSDMNVMLTGLLCFEYWQFLYQSIWKFWL